MKQINGSLLRQYSWIAKLVGKIAKQLENAMGDVGYSGDLPIPLDTYRKNAEPFTKLLP